MSKHTQEQNTNRDRRVPVSGEIYHNGRWISVDDCQAPQDNAQPPQAPVTGHYGTDEYGREVWIEGNQSEW